MANNLTKILALATPLLSVIPSSYDSTTQNLSFSAESNYAQRIEVPLRQDSPVVETKPSLMVYGGTHANKVINDYYIEATVRVESSGKPRAVSKSGALGLMQVKPDTWEEYCGDIPLYEAFDSDKNKECGVRYLRWIETYISKRHPGWDNLSLDRKRNLVAAAYHVGPTRLKNLDFNLDDVPNPTKHYVRKIEKALEELITSS